MTKFCVSFFPDIVRFALLRRCRYARLNAHVRLAGVFFTWLLLAGAAAADTSWTGTGSANWNNGANWTAGTPDSSDAVLFDNNSVANLSTNNDFSGLSVAGIVNTSASNVGPTGNVSVNGNALTVGAIGILMGGGATVNPAPPATPVYSYTGPAQVDMSVNVDLALSADQNWQTGGPSNKTLTIGASAANTVSLNGFRPTIRNISNNSDMTIVNSSIVDGTAAGGQVLFDKGTGSGNINTKSRIRLAGNSTYTGGTTITGQRQIFQLGSSSTGSTGPFGTQTITINAGSNAAYFQPYGADRSLANNISLSGTLSTSTFRPPGAASGDTKFALTLNGTITALTSAVITADNGDTEATGISDGSGPLIINGNVSIGGTLTTGAVGNASPTRDSGKITYNGVISGATMVNVVNGSTAHPATIQLSGQNTYANTTLSATGASNATTDANIQIGSSSIVDGGGNILSGPLGLGFLNFNNAGANPRIEAVGGPRTVANPVILTSGGIIQGTQDLTLTGNITGAGALAKSNTSKLTLTGSNDYTGATTVNGGTLLVNGAIGGNGGVTVAVAGTLGGTGSITGSITNNGVLAPGSSVGTLSVTGNVTDGANSSWSIELSGATADKLAVIGDIDLTAVDALNVTGTGTGSSWLIGTYTGNLTGTFDTVTPGYSVTYTGGNITLSGAPVGLPGDFNSDGKVDAGDYVTWRKNNNTNNALANDNGLGTPVGASHYNLWRANFGKPPGSGSGALNGAAVPEPAAMLLIVFGVAAGSFAHARRYP